MAWDEYKNNLPYSNATRWHKWRLVLIMSSWGTGHSDTLQTSQWAVGFIYLFWLHIANSRSSRNPLILDLDSKLDWLWRTVSDVSTFCVHTCLLTSPLKRKTPRWWEYDLSYFSSTSYLPHPFLTISLKPKLKHFLSPLNTVQLLIGSLIHGTFLVMLHCSTFCTPRYNAHGFL